MLSRSSQGDSSIWNEHFGMSEPLKQIESDENRRARQTLIENTRRIGKR